MTGRFQRKLSPHERRVLAQWVRRLRCVRPSDDVERNWAALLMLRQFALDQYTSLLALPEELHLRRQMVFRQIDVIERQQILFTDAITREEECEAA